MRDARRGCQLEAECSIVPSIDLLCQVVPEISSAAAAGSQAIDAARIMRHSTPTGSQEEEYSL